MEIERIDQQAGSLLWLEEVRPEFDSLLPDYKKHKTVAT